MATIRIINLKEYNEKINSIKVALTIAQKMMQQFVDLYGSFNFEDLKSLVTNDGRLAQPVETELYRTITSFNSWIGERLLAPIIRELDLIYDFENESFITFSQIEESNLLQFLLNEYSFITENEMENSFVEKLQALSASFQDLINTFNFRPAYVPKHLLMTYFDGQIYQVYPSIAALQKFRQGLLK